MKLVDITMIIMMTSTTAFLIGDFIMKRRYNEDCLYMPEVLRVFKEVGEMNLSDEEELFELDRRMTELSEELGVSKRRLYKSV